MLAATPRGHTTTGDMPVANRFPGHDRRMKTSALSTRAVSETLRRDAVRVKVGALTSGAFSIQPLEVSLFGMPILWVLDRTEGHQISKHDSYRSGSALKAR